MPGQKEARYVYSPAHIKTVLDKIQATGRPDKLNASYLKKTWLLQDNNYAATLQILKDMEFLKDDGTPTDRYAEYQNKNLAKKALGAGMRSAYPQLFSAYPTACSLSKEDLESYFRQHTGTSGSMLDKIVSTFSNLCSLADFSSISAVSGSQQPDTRTRIGVSPTLQLNLEIHIDANTSEATIETIFKNMRKYLMYSED